MNLEVRKSKLDLYDRKASDSDIATELLLALQSVDVEQQFRLITANSENNTASENELCLLLGIAAAQGNLELVSALLTLGANLNPTYPHIVEPLWYATANHNVDVVEHLLEAGAQIKSCNGRNVLLPAILSGNAELVSLLLKYGADPDSEFVGWPKPVLLAKALGHTEIISLLSNACTGLPHHETSDYTRRYLNQ